MSRKRKPAQTVRQGVVQAVNAVVAQGGAVLFGRDGQPFAFYPPRFVQDLAAPARQREAVERRLEEDRAEAIRAVRAAPLAPERLREAVERRVGEGG
jgi:hypothetical protein